MTYCNVVITFRYWLRWSKGILDCRRASCSVLSSSRPSFSHARTEGKTEFNFFQSFFSSKYVINKSDSSYRINWHRSWPLGDSELLVLISKLNHFVCRKSPRYGLICSEAVGMVPIFGSESYCYITSRYTVKVYLYFNKVIRRYPMKS